MSNYKEIASRMMRSFLIIFLLLSGVIPHAQFYQDLSQADRFALSVKPAPAHELAEALTKPFSTDVEKVRSIFRWITYNISYGNNSVLTKKSAGLTASDTSMAYTTLNERIAENVIERRWAVCDGYSRLFKTLCDYAGIKAEVISGYSRTEKDRVGARFNTNHTWNAVFLDSAWRLLDVTWASGYFSFGGSDYLPQFNEGYFLTAPEEFIRDHYPEDPKWTLLPLQPVIGEYINTPFKPSGFARGRVKSFFPNKGVIHTQLGDTVSIAVETDDPEKNMLVVDTLYNEDHAYDSLRHTEARGVPMGKKVLCHYIVTNENAEWLYVILNDRNVLRYKLNIRKPLAKESTSVH